MYITYVNGCFFSIERIYFILVPLLLIRITYNYHNPAHTCHYKFMSPVFKVNVKVRSHNDIAARGSEYGAGNNQTTGHSKRL